MNNVETQFIEWLTGDGCTQGINYYLSVVIGLLWGSVLCLIGLIWGVSK
ncbi:hypothetical protein [Methylomonas methanica]|uniref:Uncharacterized protein n=1 Tax=Methylomonas methanica (strain DSM 25384 / MC09) TaxID=857087 RepID=F9ZWX4_METMM|nr:hypothetical protein [Methylomonas methanica]AEG02136.1 hypothetical protein Metme_3778 [Methylomonas methanica MC09]